MCADTIIHSVQENGNKPTNGEEEGSDDEEVDVGANGGGDATGTT